MSYLEIRTWNPVWSGESQLPCSQQLRLHGLTSSELGLRTWDPRWTNPKTPTPHDGELLKGLWTDLELLHRKTRECWNDYSHTHNPNGIRQKIRSWLFHENRFTAPFTKKWGGGIKFHNEETTPTFFHQVDWNVIASHRSKCNFKTAT